MKKTVAANNIATIILCLAWCGISIYLIVKKYGHIGFKTFARSTDALEKVIIDTDAGADDAAAILLTLKSERFQVLAITCTYGNTYVDNVVDNVLKTLTIANRDDIPIYKGAQRAFIKEYKPSNYFGTDGFGDFNFTEAITAHVDESKHAALALLGLAKAHPGEITLLCIGPLTNVATAMTLDPSFATYLKKLVILGSSVSGVGNVSPSVEFNFYQDPESNSIVLNRSNTTIILFPWETVKSSSISMVMGKLKEMLIIKMIICICLFEWYLFLQQDWRINVLGKLNSTIMNFLNKAERVNLEHSTEWISSDAMTAAAMIWPNTIEASITTNVSPVIDGMARGSVLVDYAHSTGKPNNTEIIQKFNVTVFQNALLKLLS
ncbi:nucleoside hydrolase isoform X2 [Lasioglossum baleicum]|uniref:nucleoside hydrolase isoform X2 n=1 Tax=Lasioglossum baleicum TaxID=434251 RepID=UPI003FCD5067